MLRFYAGIFLVCLWTSALLAQETGIPKASTVEEYSEVADKYGPFAFAILFGLAVVWLVRGAKQVASSSERALKLQAKTYWALALVAGAASIVFAAVGTHHWLKVKASVNLFRGQIKDLAAYEQVDANDFYFRTELKPHWEGEAEPPKRNMHFVVLQQGPFARGQLFEIDYFKQGAGKRTRLKLAYEGETSSTYRIEYDEQSCTYRLERVPPRAEPAKSTPTSLLSPFVAYAQTTSPSRSTQPMSPVRATRMEGIPWDGDIKLVNLLQEPRTPVGTKIDALDRLRGLDVASLKAYAATVTDREPFALTLIELSRHTDKELASKAHMIVEKSDADAMLARHLSSQNPRVRAAAEQAVFRMSPDRAERILKQAPASARIGNLSAQVRSGEKQQVLTPVGSAEGDRYYVKANWDPKDERIVRCLTELFNRELLANRSLEEERKLMAGRSERTAYWYTREWVVSMAEKIRACGAKASFPKPTPKK